MESSVDRFWSKVDKTETCWLWAGALNTHGYGTFSLDGRKVGAHRVAYELSVGPIPDGLVIDHLCRNRSCVRPDHLEPVANGENIRRGVSLSAVRAAQTHCVHGHEFTPENTRLRSGRGGRDCVECLRRRWRERSAARRAA